jgi:hypothetical protein
MQVLVEFEMPDGGGGGGVFVADCEWHRVKLSWVSVDTLEIAYPASARAYDRKEQLLFRDRIIGIACRSVPDD